MRYPRIGALVTAASLGGVSVADAAPTPNGRIEGKGGNIGVGVSLGDPMGASAKFSWPPTTRCSWTWVGRRCTTATAR
jgi:hypothetical protein